MPRLDRSRSRESRGRDSKPRRNESRGDRAPRGDSESSGGYEEYSKNKKEYGGRRDSRGGRSFDRERRPPLEMTKVICSACKTECEVPFKPTTSKPVYCRDCFDKKGGNDFRDSDNRDRPRRYSEPSTPSRDFDRDFDVINEKLNKIMKAMNLH